MIGRAKDVGYIALLAAVLAGAAVIIPRLESRRSLELLKEQGATFDVFGDDLVWYMKLPPEGTTDDTLLLLRNNQRLNNLTLEDCTITDTGLENLGTLEKLKTLDLSGTRHIKHGLEPVCGCTALEELRIADCPWVDGDELACLTQFPNLTTLDLSGTPVSDAEVEQLLQLDQLLYLNLSRCPNITDAGARRLLELPSLLQLNLQGASITIPCWKELSAIHRKRLVHCPVENLPAFQPLSEAGGNLSEPQSGMISFKITGVFDPGILVPLGELDTLTELTICDAAIDDDDLQWVDGLSALQVLDLSGTNASDRTVKSVSRCPLTHVNLSGTRITDRGLAELARVETLASLELSQTDIQGHGFAGFTESKALFHVELSGASFNDDGAAHLARLPSLSSLSLTDTSVTDAGLASLGDAPVLWNLNVASTVIHGDGLAGLSRARTIRDLSLTCDQLDEESLRHLESFESLSQLHLGAGVGDRGVQHLTRVKGLRFLTLSGSNLTPAVAPALRHMADLYELTLTGEVSDDVLAVFAEVPGLKMLYLGDAEYHEDAANALRAERQHLRVWP